MTLALLGASGSLGRAIVQALFDRGVEPRDVRPLLRAPERSLERTEAWRARGAEPRRADYDEPESLHSAFQGVARLLLVPTMAPPSERVRQLEHALAAARAAGVGHVVHVGVLGTSLESPFEVTPFLLYAESALRTSGLPFTLLRNGLYADPIADWIPAIVALGTIPYPTGDGAASYVPRADLARAAAAVLAGEGHAGRTYRLTGPAALTTAELCRIVAEVTGKTVAATAATDEDYRSACRREDTPEPVIRLLLSMYHAVRDGHFADVTDDLERLTGRAPQSFETYLRLRLFGSGSSRSTPSSAGP